MTSPLGALASSMAEVDLSLIGRRLTETVYVLICNGEIIYIGRTVNLTSRLISHRVNVKHGGPKQFDRVLSLEVAVEDAPAMEGALIRRFNPPLCTGAPANSERDAEMLARLGVDFDPDAVRVWVEKRSAIYVESHKRRRVREWTRRKWRRVTLDETLWKATKRWLAKLETAA